MAVTEEVLASSAAAFFISYRLSAADRSQLR